MKKVLTIPSWYALSADSAKGSFFKEQALLMSEKYEVQMLCIEKEWVSWRRAFFERWIKSPRKLSELKNYPPAGVVLSYNFVKRFSKKKNHELFLKDLSLGFEEYISKHGKPDLIHAHSTVLGGIIASYISKKYQIPYIITEHFGPFVLSEFDSFYHPIIKLALEEADEVLAVSNHQKKSILRNGIECNPKVVGNLVDDSLFQIATKRSKSESVQLLYVAFYPSRVKNIPLLFDSLELLVKQQFDFHITLVGGNKESELGPNYFESEISQRELSKFCTYIPELSREEMVAQMQQSDIYISTSISETFGITACEGLLCGVPYVSTNNGGIMEFHSESNGEIVNLNDASDVAKSVRSVATQMNDFQATEMRKSIVSEYGREAFFKRIDKIYESVISQYTMTKQD